MRWKMFEISNRNYNNKNHLEEFRFFLSRQFEHLSQNQSERLMAMPRLHFLFLFVHVYWKRFVFFLFVFCSIDFSFFFLLSVLYWVTLLFLSVIVIWIEKLYCAIIKAWEWWEFVVLSISFWLVIFTYNFSFTLIRYEFNSIRAHHNLQAQSLIN